MERRIDGFTAVTAEWFWETDHEHRFTYLSGNLRRVLGHDEEYVRERLLGKTRWEIAGVDPTAEVRWRGHLDDLAARRPFRDFHVECRAANRTSRHLSVAGDPVFDDAGMFLGYRGVARDDTETVSAGRRITEAEVLLRDAIESVSEGFVIYDAEDRLVLCNTKFRELLPTGAESIVPAAPLEILRKITEHGQRPDGGIGAGDWQRERLARRADAAGAVERQLSDGRWLRITEKRTAAGGLAGLWMDVTALKRAEEALRRSEERYELALEGSDDGLWDWDLRRHTVFRSRRVQEILGLDPATIESSPSAWMQIVHPLDAQRYRSELRRYLKGRTDRFVCEYRVRDATGVYRWVADRAKAFREADGRVHRMVGCTRDVTVQKETEERVRFLAYYDPVTRLPNQTLLADRLGHAIAACRRTGGRGALLLVDVTDFRDVLAGVGVAKGDALLVAIGDRLKRMLRPADTVARCGSAQFGVLLPDVADPDGVTAALYRIQRSFSGPVEAEGVQLHVAIDIGVAMFPSDGDTADVLLRHAATALADILRTDVLRYRFYCANMTTAAVCRLTLQERLREAIESDRLEVHYEPQLDVQGLQVVGVEALVRWWDAELGAVPPAKFIPVAERSGLIDPLGVLVLRTACRQLAAWKAEGKAAFPMSVNVSREQFRDAGFAAVVGGALDATGLGPGDLVLEITESTILQNPERALRIMEQLSEMGVQVAIDDFGVEHSALSHLARFPVHSIKIDIAFVSRMTYDPRFAAVVQAIVSMAKVMQKRTIAEGVETADQLLFLRAYGCDALQGHLYSKALPAPEFERYLLSARSSASG